MSDVLRSTTFQLEFKGQDGITGVRQFTKAVTDADAVVDKLSETLGNNVDVTVKNVRSKAELTAEAKRLVTQMEKTNVRVAEMTKLYELQTSMIGKTANEQEVLNAVYRLGANATQEQKTQVTNLVQNYQRMRAETEQTHGSFRNLRGVSQQLGWQIQDVAVQAQMGTSAFVIIGQQGSQLAAAFGPTGALVGAFIAVASVIAGTFFNSLVNAGEEVDLLTAKIKDLTKSQRELARLEITEAMDDTVSAMEDAQTRLDRLSFIKGGGEAYDKKILELNAALEKGKVDLTNYKERLAELNGAPSKDTVKTFDNMTEGLKRNIIALRDGEKQAALYNAQQEIMKNAKENKLSDDVVKQQIADVTSLINEEYRLKDVKEAAKKSEQAAKKDRSAEQAVLKAQESEFDSLRKSMEKGTNTVNEEYSRRKAIIDRHVATVGSVDAEAAQAYGVLEEWKTEKLKDEYNKRETVRKSIENAQKTQAKKEDPTGSENALFEQNLKTLRDQKAQSGQLELAERQRIDSLMEAEVTRHTQRLNEISNTQLIATLENYATFTGSLGGVFKQMQSMAEEGSKEAAALFYINQAIALADTIVNTELAATKAMGQLGVFGIPASTLIRATGYASAGIIAGQTIVGAYDEGGNIPAGGIGIVSEYADELVNGQLVKGPARVTSSADTAKLMNSGGTSLKVVVDNKISGASYSVQQVDESTVKLIAEQVFSNNIDSGVSGVLNNRNSKTTKSMKNKFTVRSKF